MPVTLVQQSTPRVTLTQAYTGSLQLETQEITLVLGVPREGPQGATGPTGPTGPAGPSSSAYVHTQGAASATWTIPHNLGFTPSVEVRTTGGLVVDAEVLHLSANVAQVNLVAPLAGTARCN